MTDECNDCGGPLKIEDVPTDTDGLPPEWYLDGSCANCAFEAGAEDHARATGKSVSLEDYRASHGHLYFRDPGNVSPETEALVLAENDRIAKEEAHTDA